MSQTDKRADGAETGPRPADRELSDAELTAVAAAGDKGPAPDGGSKKPEPKD